MKGERVILAAHRGDRAGYPENTMPAFLSAVEFGADMIETDVRETKDGVLVLIHDRSTLRTTGVDKNVDEMTLAELKRLDAGATFEDGRIKAEIPTVREFIEGIRDSGILVNWELKVYPEDFGDEVAFGIADKLVDLIFEYGLENRSMLNSFSDRVLEHIKGRYGDAFPIHGQGIGACKRTHDDASISEEELFDWCCMYPNMKGKRALDYPENFEYAVKNGVIPCICIRDTLEDYRIALELGCKMFTTNDMRECDRILRALGVR